MKAIWKGVVVADSGDTVLVEGNHYFPASSLKREYTSFSNHRSSCPWKGQARYYDLVTDAAVAPKAAWTYPHPNRGFEPIAGAIAQLSWIKGRPINIRPADQTAELENAALAGRSAAPTNWRTGTL